MFAFIQCIMSLLLLYPFSSYLSKTDFQSFGRFSLFFSSSQQLSYLCSTFFLHPSQNLPLVVLRVALSLSVADGAGSVLLCVFANIICMNSFCCLIIWLFCSSKRCRSFSCVFWSTAMCSFDSTSALLMLLVYSIIVD